MRAGLLRHRLILQKRNEATRDAYGDVTTSWETTETRWGSVQPLRGRELLEANKQDGRLTHKIITRYITTITPDMRFIFGSRTFNITSAVRVNERDIMMEIYAQEITGFNIVGIFNCLELGPIGGENYLLLGMTSNDLAVCEVATVLNCITTGTTANEITLGVNSNRITVSNC